jgi:uncharacterized protein (TIGR03086 family)
MDATTAMNQTDQVVTSLISGLSPEHREMPTPCADWTVHDLIEHMCGGGHMVAGALQGEAPPDEAPDLLAEGPAIGWAGTAAHMVAAATPEVLAAKHQMPFGEVPGEMALSVIVADQVVHAWDLAQATGQDPQVDDELASFALQTWQMVVPAEGRTGDGFAAAVAVPDDTSALDRVVAYTGRQP